MLEHVPVRLGHAKGFRWSDRDGKDVEDKLEKRLSLSKQEDSTSASNATFI